MQSQLSNQEKPKEPAQSEPTWKTNVELSLKFPVLIFLITVSSSNQECRSDWYAGQGIYRTTLLLILSGLIITFLDNKKLMNFFQTFIFVFSLLTIFIGMLMKQVDVVNQIQWKGPFSSEDIRICGNWRDLLDKSLLEVGRLIFSGAVLVILWGCPWVNREESGVDHSFVRNFKKFSVGAFKLLLVSGIFTSSAIFATFLTKFFYQFLFSYSFVLFGCKIVFLRLFWSIVFVATSLIELITFSQYSMKMKDSTSENDYFTI